MSELAQHLQKVVGGKAGKPIEVDHETDRERYEIGGQIYDVETVNVRLPETREVAQERHVFIVEPLSAGHGDVFANEGVCPTCGRPMGRTTRRTRIYPPEA